MKILHLTLTKKWFDMILSGEKTEEYREIKDYWIRRLLFIRYDFQDDPLVWQEMIDNLRRPQFYPLDVVFKDYEAKFIDFDAIEFRNGYSKTAPAMIVECKGITTGIGNPAWGAPVEPVFIIKCGKVLETRNCENLRFEF